MTIPIGSGSEVVKVFKFEELDNSPEIVLINGVANHIYTVVSLIVTNSRGDSGNFHLKVTDSAGANECFVIKNETLPVDSTFVWADRFSMVGDNHLVGYCGSALDNMDVYVTYVDQDWS